MSQPSNKRSSRRRRSGGKGNDLWRDAGPLPEVEPVPWPEDPTALVRSLGEPPLVRGNEVALHFATVVERSAVLAAALSANILAPDVDTDADVDTA